jgi:hypothetical protein
MRRTIEAPSAGLAIVIVLGLAQALLGSLRALDWVRMGTDLLGRGLLLVPIAGSIALARGFLVAGIALFYAAFAWGALARYGWAWWIGLVAALLNALLVLAAAAQGASVIEAILWIIVPVVVILYLLAPAGRQTLYR